MMLHRSVMLLLVSLFSATCLARVISRPPLESSHTSPRTLGETYNLNPKDGWHNATTGVERRANHTPGIAKLKSKWTLDRLKKDANSLPAKLRVQLFDTKITWYTGNDLKNPSCWPKTPWTPTDDSMIAAVTAEGWEDHPDCLDFVEMCTSEKDMKCSTVRIVDTCAGCAKGSKHIDLSKAAFRSLGLELGQGVGYVMWSKSDWKPDHWDEKRWGPKV